MAGPNGTRSWREERRKLISQKLRIKRNTIITVWALAFAYLAISAEEVGSAPADEPDLMPNSRSLLFSPGTGRSYEMFLKTPILGAGDEVNSESGLDSNCTPPAIAEFPPDLFTQSQRRSGAVVFHFLVSAYIFYALALVCDDYFVPAIECICEELHLPSDVAGASFMAIGTSAPELFTNVIGTFITEGDIGVGTIVGSAVFNILAVSACCGLAAHQAIALEWWPLTRDCIFYSVSVILLLLVLINRQVFWYEALVLVCCYGVYIFVMYHNTAFKRAAEKLVDRIRNSCTRRARRRSRRYSEKSPLIDEKSLSSTSGYSGLTGEKDEYSNGDPGFKDSENEEEDDLGMSVEVRDEMLISKALYQSEVHAEEEKEEWGIFSLPFGQGAVTWAEWILGWPVRLCYTVTIPDCREHNRRKWFPLTFGMCILWIASLSYIVSWMMTVIGHTLQVPDSVMGLTFIAAGTSVPEAVSSVIVTRQGLGGMGISNSIGSNTFDILICLGLPWLIRGALIASAPVNFIQIHSKGIEYSTILLIASLILLYTLLASNGFVLDRRVGLISLTMYACFLVISSLFELNVFFQVNLPTCEV